jgi:hypothetical protein
MSMTLTTLVCVCVRTNRWRRKTSKRCQMHIVARNRCHSMQTGDEYSICHSFECRFSRLSSHEKHEVNKRNSSCMMIYFRPWLWKTTARILIINKSVIRRYLVTNDKYLDHSYSLMFIVYANVCTQRKQWVDFDHQTTNGKRTLVQTYVRSYNNYVCVCDVIGTLRT